MCGRDGARVGAYDFRALENRASGFYRSIPGFRACNVPAHNRFCADGSGDARGELDEAEDAGDAEHSEDLDDADDPRRAEGAAVVARVRADLACTCLCACVSICALAHVRDEHFWVCMLICLCARARVVGEDRWSRSGPRGQRETW